MIFKFTFFQTMNNVIAFKKIINANFDGFFKRMLVKSESLSKPLISYVQLMRNKFLGKLNDSLSIHLLVVNDSQISTKNFAILYIDVFKADKTYLKHKQPSTHLLCTLQEPYFIQGIVLIGFRYLWVSSDMLLDLASLF